jgi:glycosyltransferase involved in cell wall biosynthesis
MKTVSVIIPCYRDAATLARAIDSVLAQSYPMIEIVVVNDCSPESEEIERVVARYPFVRYLRNASNLGLAATRNVGIVAANGDYVALLDADDEYHVDKITVQMAATEPGIALTCGLTYVHADGRREISALVRGGPRLIVDPAQILYRNTLNGAGLLIERELLLAYGGFDASLRSSEDFDLWLRLLGSGVRVKDVGQPLYLYYVNPAGLSKNFLNMSKWEAETIRRYATRMGDPWRRSATYASVVSIWLLRHLMRYELQPGIELRQQVQHNLELLADFPLLLRLLRFAARLHLLFWPARLLRIAGLLRGS